MLRERNDSAVCGVSCVCPNVCSAGLCGNLLFTVFMVLDNLSKMPSVSQGQTGDLPGDTERQKAP